MVESEGPVRRDWAEWHEAYDDPGSPLSRRLLTVQERIRDVLDEAPPGPIIAVSSCAGQGRDLLGVLAGHPRSADVAARLVELDEHNVRVARAAIEEAGLANVEAVAGDASRTDAFAGAVPADLVLVCGVFGNLADADIERTISLLPQLCAEGAHVVWTRNRRPPDVTPHIHRWFEKHGFEKRWSSPPLERGYGVGVHRYRGEPAPLERGVRLFTFVGYDALRKGAPWPR
ncbi:SAM-dependent methyltransferase [Actinomadura sp. 6N118]|uniref:SAM-dependent methyltransferase n=1 Tax=Actinomadura sp. 6N118 TaxID=3375151 RepID=UPI0037BB2705